MNLPGQPIIVVLGMLTHMPVGGVIWQTVHYLIGLQRLGFEVYYMEDHGIPPSMFSDANDPDGSTRAAAFLGEIMSRFDLGARWSYRSWSENYRHYGLGEASMARVFERAAAVINLHGGTCVRPEHQKCGTLIYLETDPVTPEIELYHGVKATEDFLDAHTAHFTFAENLGAPDCKVPLPPTKYRFHSTRQPVVLDFWQPNHSKGECFTTIANWRQPVREVTFQGVAYSWSKHHEFMKFLDLPKRVAQPFELALSSYEAGDRDLLEERGWRVRAALEFSRDLDSYRDYIQGSRGEWTVAKDQNVRLRSGWFSDRAASYLAAGRPVVTQDTGFSRVLPTGKGLFAFSSMEETVAAIEQVNEDYALHSRAAAEIAQTYFDSNKVLSALLQNAGVTLPRRGD